MPNSVTALRRVTSHAFAPTEATTTINNGSEPERILNFDRFKNYFEAEPENKWQVEILRKLLDYVNLPEGWDGYSGHPLRWDTGLFALWVLNSVMRSRTPLPDVVPSSGGAVQLEWHEKDIDLELHIASPYSCELWFEDHRIGKQISCKLSNDFTILAEPIMELTAR
jgi:hypothetical protein